MDYPYTYSNSTPAPNPHTHTPIYRRVCVCAEKVDRGGLVKDVHEQPVRI